MLTGSVPGLYLKRQTVLLAALLLGLLGVALAWVCCYLQQWGSLFYHLLPVKLPPRILIDAGVNIAY